MATIGACTAESGRLQVDIMADAAHWILTQPKATCTANFFIDDEVTTGWPNPCAIYIYPPQTRQGLSRAW